MQHFFTALLFCLSVSVYSQSVVYVTPTGSGNQTGISWSNALPGTQLQSQLASASSGAQFWVAGGRYAPGTQRESTFFIPSGVQVYGGFAGNETQLANRVLSRPSSTTFTGEIGNLNSTNDNSYHVVTFTNASSSTRLDGFVITRGNADNGSTYEGNGGGLFNKSTQAGNNSPAISNCYIVDNQANYGAGMANIASGNSVGNPTLTDCVFSNNVAQDAGGLWNFGANATANPILTNCHFESNTAWYRNGGAITTQGSTDDNNIVGVANLSLKNCTFTKNKAGYGGAIFVAGFYGQANPIISSCTFYSNTATISGGAISSEGFYGGTANARIDNCLFANNIATRGGAISNSATNGTCNPELKNCTIASNRVFLGLTNVDNGSGAIYSTITSTIGTCSTVLLNCLIWDNTTNWDNRLAIKNEGTASTQATYSDIEGGYPGIGTINRDPFFVSPASNDFRLLSISPAINAGDPSSTTANVSTSDIDGNSRIIRERIDMGAYEFKARFGQGVLVHVTPTGTGDGSGSSWANALPGNQLQQALVDALPGTTFWIAKGTYKPTTGIDRYKSFWVGSGVQVYGNFNGTETALSQRDGNFNWTVFSGDIGVVNDTKDNSHSVVRFRNATASTRLDGIIIRDGNHTIDYSGLSNGRAKGGGGIYNDGSGPGNRSEPTIANCQILNNQANSWGGGLFNDGSRGFCFPVLQNCLIQNNYGGFGGGIYSEGDGGTGNITLQECTIDNNRAVKGAGIYSTALNSTSARADINVSNCVFTNNWGWLEGGAAYFETTIGGVSRPSFTNCLFFSSVAIEYGGAIRSSARFYSDISVTILNSTFVNSYANRKGQLIYSSIENNSQGSYSIRNSVVRNGSSMESDNGSNMIAPTYNVTYSNIQGGFAGTGNIDADPLFVDVPSGNFRLLRNSSSINTGDPSSTVINVSAMDLAGGQRVVGGRIDMGAYEYAPFADLRMALAVATRTPAVGQAVSYNLTIINDGPEPTTNVAWQNRLPANLIFAGGTGVSETNGILNGAINSLAPGESATFSYQLQPQQPGQYINAAQITASGQPDPDSQPNSGTGDGQDDAAQADFRTASDNGAVYTSPNPNQTPLPTVARNQPPADPAKADLNLAMTVSNRTPKAGDVITVTLRIENAGGLNATGVGISLNLPAGISFVSGNGFSAAGQTITGSVGSVGTGSSATVTAQLRITSGNPARLTAEITASSQPDPDSQPNSGVTDGQDDAAVLDLRISQ